MPASRLSPWTHLPSQHKSLERSVVKPIDWNSFTRDQEMPDAPTNKSSVIVSLKLPAKYWSNGRIIGTSVSKSRSHHGAAACSEGSSNGAPANRDVEILDGLIGSQRLKHDDYGENRNPFRRAKASGIWETDLQHYRRLSFRMDGIEGMGPTSQESQYGFIVFDKSSGALWYKGSSDAIWERVVFHHWIRDEISEVENGRGEDDNFEHGIFNGDITCFSTFKRRPSNRAQSSSPAGNLRYDGVLVIDYGLSPVRAFREFPVVLCSEYAGASMLDAQLQNSAIMLKDFRARMPPVIQQRIEGKLVLKPLYTIETIGARVSGIREATMVISTSKSHDKTTRQNVTKDTDLPVEGHNVIMQQDRRLTKSAPPNFLPTDENDARNLSPMTALEALALWEALHITVDHFLRLTGREPLRNEDRPAPNYCAQWMDMQKQLRQIWEKTTPAPFLVSRGGWTGGIANWTFGQPSIRGW